MRIINIYCNGNLVSKDWSTIYDWVDYCLKNHYEFKICFVEVKKNGKR